MTRHYSEHRAREQFQRKLEQLRFEIRVESPRRVLDYLIDHLEDLLPRCGATILRDSFREQLESAKQQVSTRHNLRIVKSNVETPSSSNP